MEEREKRKTEVIVSEWGGNGSETSDALAFLIWTFFFLISDFPSFIFYLIILNLFMFFLKGKFVYFFWEGLIMLGCDVYVLCGDNFFCFFWVDEYLWLVEWILPSMNIAFRQMGVASIVV